MAQRNSHSQHPNDDGFLMDFIRFGPAPTPQRELVYTILSVFAMVFIAVRMELTMVWIVVLAVIALYIAVRWIMGISVWRQREEP